MVGDILEIEKDGKWVQDEYSKIKRQFSNKFIAVKNKEIIANGQTMQIVMKRVEKSGYNPAQILIEYIFEEKMALIL